jgi:hypothetical protein
MKTLELPFIYRINGLKTTNGSGAAYKCVYVTLAEGEVVLIEFKLHENVNIVITATYDSTYSILAIEALIKHYQVMCERMPHDSSIDLNGKPEFPELKNTLSYW